MRKTACALILLATLGGCVSGPQSGPSAANCPSCFGPRNGPPTVPGVQGPWGTPVPMAAPYSAAPPAARRQAYAMMAKSMPLNMVQMHNLSRGNSGIVQAQYQSSPPGARPPNLMAPGGRLLSPPGLPAAPGLHPGGGIQQAVGFGPDTGARSPYGAVAAVGAMRNQGQLRFHTSRTQVRFLRPSGMKVFWYTRTPDGRDSYSQVPIEAPGRYNFTQAAVYRLKLTNIPGHPGLELYPTLEVVPANPHTETFLAHASVPIAFTPEDFKQVVAGNFVVKVIYLPNPYNQDLAFTAPGEIVSTQLEPGADPIKEALRRGSILLVIRMGNMDQEAPNTPNIGTPGPNMQAPQGLSPQQQMMMRQQQMMRMLPPGQMVPYGMPPRMPMMPGMPPTGAPNPNAGAANGNGVPGQKTSQGAMMPGQMPMPPRPGMPAYPGQMQRPPYTMYPGQMPAMPPNPGAGGNSQRSSQQLPVPPQVGVPTSRAPGSSGLRLTAAWQTSPAPEPSAPTHYGSSSGWPSPCYATGSNCKT